MCGGGGGGGGGGDDDDDHHHHRHHTNNRPITRVAREHKEIHEVTNHEYNKCKIIKRTENINRNITLSTYR